MALVVYSVGLFVLRPGTGRGGGGVFGEFVSWDNFHSFLLLWCVLSCCFVFGFFVVVVVVALLVVFCLFVFLPGGGRDLFLGSLFPAFVCMRACMFAKLLTRMPVCLTINMPACVPQWNSSGHGKMRIPVVKFVCIHSQLKIGEIAIKKKKK